MALFVVITAPGVLGAETRKPAISEIRARQVGEAAARPVQFGLDAPAQPTLAQQVEQQLEQDPLLRDRNIVVSVQNTTAWLTGIVGSQEEKNRALRIAQRVDGVNAVRDELFVRNPLFEPGKLGNRPASRLNPLWVGPPFPYAGAGYGGAYGGYGSGYGYSPGYYRGGGDVPSPRQRAPYSPYDERWQGEWPYSDADIRQSLNSHLFNDPYLSRMDVDLEIRDGVVTMTGSVNSWSERRRAEMHAYQSGARYVINRLRVSPW